jgi:hypothetical protein
MHASQVSSNTERLYYKHAASYLCISSNIYMFLTSESLIRNPLIINMDTDATLDRSAGEKMSDRNPTNRGKFSRASLNIARSHLGPPPETFCRSAACLPPTVTAPEYPGIMRGEEGGLQYSRYVYTWSNGPKRVRAMCIYASVRLSVGQSNWPAVKRLIQMS